jgi:hypothetical protein
VGANQIAVATSGTVCAAVVGKGVPAPDELAAKDVAENSIRRPRTEALHEQLSTVDYKHLGLLYIFKALVFLVIGGVETHHYAHPIDAPAQRTSRLRPRFWEEHANQSRWKKVAALVPGSTFRTMGTYFCRSVGGRR